MVQIPDFLEKGDTVAIISPSGPIEGLFLDNASTILQSWGLQVIIGKNAALRSGVFAGTDDQRLQDFQEAINNPEIKAIFCSRGGYGAIRIVDSIDFSLFIQKQKWIIGFSDITVFHAKLSKLGVASIHGAMPKTFSTVSAESLESLKQMLFGTILPIEWNTTPFNKPGTCTGKLVGGNLSMLYSMRGLQLEFDYTDSILFIEDLNEYLYHIDRIMQNLKLSGILGSIKGLVVGTMSGMKNGVDEYGGSVESIILEVVKEYSYPVCFNFPAGHESQNMAIIMGIDYSLEVSKNCKLLPISVPLSNEGYQV